MDWLMLLCFPPLCPMFCPPLLQTHRLKDQAELKGHAVCMDPEYSVMWRWVWWVGVEVGVVGRCGGG